MPLFQKYSLAGSEQTFVLMKWFSVRTLDIDWSLRFDALTAVMLLVVNVISAMVHVYSLGYILDLSQ
jgi:NADH-quinone oxidoreductase subunit L